jgi:glycosyltransferase involved in cell wall biosynthesis
MLMRVLLISPYHGGSHQAWAKGYRQNSQHSVDLLTLPARFWKWRMHGGAVTLAHRFLRSVDRPDVILATDMLDLTTFLALTRHRTSDIPVAYYMHENQLTYPLPQDGSTGPMRRQLGERDRHYAFINYVSMLSAGRIFFNSHYHHDSFYNALPGFLKHFPEYNELSSVAVLREKSEILPVGIDLHRLDQGAQRSEGGQFQESPLLLWNQRWEYDKNPEDFFAALITLANEGIPFRVALCGQQYGKQPAAFADGQSRLGDRVIHSGYASAEKYASLLWEANITISTAVHEFFGISIVEAIYAHTFPILPARLSYPELLPLSHHPLCLYSDQDELVTRLRWALSHRDEARKQVVDLATAVSRFDWTVQAPLYDQALAGCAKLIV